MTTYSAAEIESGDYQAARAWQKSLRGGESVLLACRRTDTGKVLFADVTTETPRGTYIPFSSYSYCGRFYNNNFDFLKHNEIRIPVEELTLLPKVPGVEIAYINYVALTKIHNEILALLPSSNLSQCRGALAALKST